ncbi:transposase [Paraburkholderia sp. BL6669N2]|uniref:IS66-like element accessory protein TnpA n=1 Tax=Paraburkholderia sp. BL6669N2 TaxID=1938807 RepID=UPI000E280DE6|nr:transposase [Paraburkholderia sp. BL6669N2]REG45603.1 transposase [Paraburkholderia sp. BL6669N2]
MPIVSDLMGITLSQSEEKKPRTRMGRPNYTRELRERLAAAACEPGVSVAKLARENGINANMLFTWRRKYLADQQARSDGLILVVLVSDTAAEVVASPQVEPRAHDTKPAAPAGTIEIRIGRAVFKLDGLFDADILRIVLGSLRS